MECPYCKRQKTKVIDSRETADEKVRRRRKCLDCGKKFTTYEVYEQRLFKLDELEHKVNQVKDVVRYW